MSDQDLPAVDVWFPLFAKDWLTGTTFLMSAEQCGMFINLLAHAWIQSPPASLPNDEYALAMFAKAGTVERWREAGAIVRAQFDVGADGRLRNAKQWAIYLDALQRRERHIERAHKGANARWGKKKAPAPAPPPPPPAQVEPLVLGDVVKGHPTLAAWVAERDDNREALRGMLVRARAIQGGKATTAPHYAAIANAALQGMDGPKLTGDQLRTALLDWTATDNPGTPNSLRSFLSGAVPGAGRGKQTAKAGQPKRASKLETE